MTQKESRIRTIRDNTVKNLPKIGLVFLLVYTVILTGLYIFNLNKTNALQVQLELMQQGRIVDNQVFNLVLDRAWEQIWVDGQKPEPFQSEDTGSCWRVPELDIPSDNVINKAIRCESLDGVVSWQWDAISLILDE